MGRAPEGLRMNGNRIRLNIFSKLGGILLAFVVLCIGLTIASPVFLSIDNLLIVCRQAVFVMIIGFAMTFVITMAGIDLSVGAILCIAGVVLAKMLLAGVSVWIALLATLAFGMVIGIVNGILIAKIGIADFIATLGMMSILRGIIMLVTHGVPLFGLQFRTFQFFAQGYIGIIPFPIILALILFVICLFLFKKTRFGRFVIAIGSNSEAASLVGINLARVRILVYMFSGLFAAISGVLLSSRMEAALPDAGQGYELDVIAATVIGGTSLSGGRGSLVGTVLGALVMAVVRNGLNLLSVNVFWHQTVIGIIILIAVSIDRLSKKATA
jgi:ribose transport system permease protein